MFDNQFYIAKMCFNKDMPLIMVYAIETSLQLAISEFGSIATVFLLYVF